MNKSKENEKSIIEGFLIRNGIIKPPAATEAADKCLRDCMKIVEKVLKKKIGEKIERRS